MPSEAFGNTLVRLVTGDWVWIDGTPAPEVSDDPDSPPGEVNPRWNDEHTEAIMAKAVSLGWAGKRAKPAE